MPVRIGVILIAVILLISGLFMYEHYSPLVRQYEQAESMLSQLAPTEESVIRPLPTGLQAVREQLEEYKSFLLISYALMLSSGIALIPEIVYPEERGSEDRN